jgi:hypothetical protein
MTIVQLNLYLLFDKFVEVYALFKIKTNTNPLYYLNLTMNHDHDTEFAACGSVLTLKTKYVFPF